MLCSLKTCDKPAHNLVKSRCLGHCLNIVCFNPNCGKKPFYNYQGLSKGLYCAEHKPYIMINVKKNKPLYSIVINSINTIKQKDSTGVRDHDYYVYDKGSYKVLIECDKGISYEDSAEHTRMRQLFFSLGSKNLVIIRHYPNFHTDDHDANNMLELLKTFKYGAAVSDPLTLYRSFHNDHSENTPNKIIIDPYSTLVRYNFINSGNHCSSGSTCSS